MTSTGTHQFFADPRKTGLADYEFILHKLNPPFVDGGTYQPNTYAEATTTQPGQVVRYNVEFSKGDFVYLEVVRSEATTDFVLTEPGGRNNAFSSYTNAGPIELKRTGTYTLDANPRSTNLGDYDIRLHKLDPAVIQGGDITHNEVVSGTTRQPGQIAEYSITLDEPGQVSLEVVRKEITADYTLYSADGRSKVFSSYTNVAGKSLAPGTYKMIVDPRAKATGSYDFLLRVQPNGG